MFKRHLFVIIAVLLAINLTVVLSVLNATEESQEALKSHYYNYLFRVFENYHDESMLKLDKTYHELLKDDDLIMSVLQADSDQVADKEDLLLDRYSQSVDYILVASEDLTILDERGAELMADMMLTDVFNDARDKDDFSSTIIKVGRLYYYVAAGPLMTDENKNDFGVLLLAKHIQTDTMHKTLTLHGQSENDKIMIEDDKNTYTVHHDEIAVCYPLEPSPYYLKGYIDIASYNQIIKQTGLREIFTLITCMLIGGVVLLFVINRVYVKANKLNCHLKAHVDSEFTSELKISDYDNYHILKGIAESAEKISNSRRHRINQIDHDNQVVNAFLAATYTASTEHNGTHQDTVKELASIICDELGIKDKKAILHAAQMHDIGMLTIPRSIVNKPDELTPDERKLIETHVSCGSDYIAATHYFGGVADLIASHHENWDGTGYPEGLKGDAIPMGAQIIALADVYDALTSNRPYRLAMTHEQASIIILENTGRKFSPRLVEAYKNVALKLKQAKQS